MFSIDYNMSLIAFIIGAGKNIGEHTAAALKAKGYKVALGSRKPAIDQVKKDGYLPVVVNVESPESVKTAFSQVTKELGPPNVVIFNAATFVPPPVPEDPLSQPLEVFKQHTDVGLALYAAAQEALAGFRSEIHKDVPKTFIVTGNPLPWVTINRPGWLGMNVEKTFKWRLIEILSDAYSKEGIRFHYATLVGESGGIIDPLSKFFTSGAQHAQVYLDLVTRKDQADWDYRFTFDGKQWTK
ncbi:hypothetical protein MSAN_01769800 [Mycena sanguinolenta]|uniref:Uncharacterized protein n=1 Tax=Mycena sanguinolenta TaxID=230812 RepID=A0A8H6XXG4_9AGAR|nr:hypothetical protein MSAN_01769800 [Mycena sanguinolenta]